MALIRKQNQKEYEARVVQPLVSIREEEKSVLLEAEMSGLTREDISLDLKGDELTLTGKVKQEEETVPEGYTIAHKERCPFEYVRTFILGDDIDKSNIDAQYENGVLKVRLIKSEKAQPKKIVIKS
jgi:HSP20 family protein